MKKGIYSLLKAKFLINDDALKNWKFIVFIIFLAMIMVANNHQYDAKNYKITALTAKSKEMRSKFIDNRSQLMKLKMESTISKKLEAKEIFPSEVPPVRIVVIDSNSNNWIDKIKIWN